MRYDPDDPSLTAYALGELDGAEKAAVEARLAGDEAARREVEAIRASAGRLAAALETEAAPGLDADRRAAIDHAVGGTSGADHAGVSPLQLCRRRLRIVWLCAGMAASVVIAAGVWSVLAVRESPGDGTRLRYWADRPVPAGAPARPAPREVAAREEFRPATAAPTVSTLPAAPAADLPASASSPPTRGVQGRTAYDSPPMSAPPPVMASAPPSVRSGRRDPFDAPRAARVPAHPSGAPDKSVFFPDASPSDHNEGMKGDSRDFLSHIENDTEASRFDTEAYDHPGDNPFLPVAQNPLSTFSIDVDTASYANVRRFLIGGRRPPKDAVRIEEMINYFPYSYAPPSGDAPFAVHVEIASCPWDTSHRLVRVGLKGREIAAEKRPASNLVFLIDVSGSMQPENKLPLLKTGLRMLAEQLTENDRVAIAVYAGHSGLVLPTTVCDDRGRAKVLAALDRLEAGGSTNGGQGIQLAYRVASEHFVPGGVNRVVLATDGDFNVGVTAPGDLVRLIEEKAKTGVFLSVLGFGMGNVKDATMEKLADKGNGNYAYIDTLQEARKVLVEQMTGTLCTIAKDVKIQIEFNPARASAFRLIGYENRLLRHEDFNDDTKDAGEIGAGHTVTALYEVVPPGAGGGTGVDPLKYRKPEGLSAAADSDELLTLKLRYKEPDGEKSRLIEVPVADKGARFDAASRDFRFASAVAAFGMILRDSPHKAGASYDLVAELAHDARGDDPQGYRFEFTELVRKAKAIQRR